MVRVIVEWAPWAVPALSASARCLDDIRRWTFGHGHVRFVKCAETIALRGDEPRLDDAERVRHSNCGLDF